MFIFWVKEKVFVASETNLKNIMLTKKEKLLTRPWTVKKYENHRRKVKSAEPAVDFRPPSSHPHVTTKLKKVQRERERLDEIERENRRLLQRLGEIMNTRRLENFWQQPRPNFLNREKIFGQRPKTTATSGNTITSEPIMMTSYKKIELSGSLARCPACSGKSVPKKDVIPEERIPWALPKKSMNRKLVNEVPKTHLCCRYCC